MKRGVLLGVVATLVFVGPASAGLVARWEQLPLRLSVTIPKAKRSILIGRPHAAKIGPCWRPKRWVVHCRVVESAIALPGGGSVTRAFYPATVKRRRGGAYYVWDGTLYRWFYGGR